MTARPSAELPAGAVPPVRHPDAPGVGEQILSHYAWCYGCGANHPAGLHCSSTPVRACPTGRS